MLLEGDTGIAGWVRVCGECGQFDMHSVLPDAAMLGRPDWFCETCHASELMAAHIRVVPLLFNEDDDR